MLCEKNVCFRIDDLKLHGCCIAVNLNVERKTCWIKKPLQDDVVIENLSLSGMPGEFA